MDVNPRGHLRPAPRHRVASPISQGLVAAAAAVPITGLAWRADMPTFLVLGLLALAIGIAVGLSVDLGGWFDGAPGMVSALIAMVTVLAVQVLLVSQEIGGGSWWIAPWVGVLVIGLDWRWTSRLQAVVVASGVATLLLADLSAPTAPGLLVAWALLAAGGLWSLRRDAEAALSRPIPMAASGQVLRSRWRAAAAIAVSTLVASLVVALLSMVVLPSFGLNSSGEGRSGDGSQADGISPHWGQGGGGFGSGGGAEGARDINGDGQADEFDIDGDGIYDVDRHGNPLNGAGGTPGAGNWTEPGSGGSSGEATGAEDATTDLADSTREGPNLGMILLVMLAAAAVAAAAWWFWRRQARLRALAARPWPVRVAERIEAEGARRGRRRHPAEPIGRYTSALAESVLPDARLAALGATVSSGLFGPPGEVSDNEAWATEVLDEATAAHPVPRRWSRSRD